MDSKKLEDLRKVFQTQAIYIIALICLFFVVNWAVSLQGSGVSNKKARLESEIRKMTADYNELSSKAEEIKEAVQLWKTLNEDVKKNTGLKIDEAKETIDLLRQDYFIAKDFSIVLTPPKELENAYKTSSTSVVESEVEMKFASTSDVNILNFVLALQQRISGFVKITSFKLSKQKEVSDTDLNSIRIGEFPPLVGAELKFLWRDLKDTGEKK